MNGVDLTQAIRKALQEAHTARRLPTAMDISQEAASAQACVEANMEALANVGIPTADPRRVIALQLIRASLDHARALLYLLATHPADMTAVALGMHRPQIELFLRAVFVQFLADDDQLDDFLKEDLGPRKRTPKGKWVAIPFKDLASMVEATIARLGDDDAPQKLARTFTNAWDPLCGLVHGGRSIRALYRDDNGHIGANVSAEVMFQTTVNTVATSNYAIIAALLAAGVSVHEVTNTVTRAGQGMERYMHERAGRMARLALKP
ncbi:DUF6988 family protein [Luteimonas fraxinea]|uniref:Uncharacterized protein n=1 Tax=Luteimonas fraxinea TaxID=2901869 RepID=A0ABS8UC83_9GAMM|nr:hypothetical protein [Luteimonas fraxinea]MCD9096674.1 hypothetical protein [Luteimonas fraxinea]MCD9126044.1 hypothetical protein [Luteimonas fraxinea]